MPDDAIGDARAVASAMAQQGIPTALGDAEVVAAWVDLMAAAQRVDELLAERAIGDAQRAGTIVGYVATILRA